jgi:hypothetical protein
LKDDGRTIESFLSESAGGDEAPSLAPTPYSVNAKKFYIETYGCQMNISDSEIVHGVLAAAGYEKTVTLEEADAIFINTCSIRDNAENKV